MSMIDHNAIIRGLHKDVRDDVRQAIQRGWTIEVKKSSLILRHPNGKATFVGRRSASASPASARNLRSSIKRIEGGQA